MAKRFPQYPSGILDSIQLHTKGKGEGFNGAKIESIKYGDRCDEGEKAELDEWPKVGVAKNGEEVKVLLK